MCRLVLRQTLSQQTRPSRTRRASHMPGPCHVYPICPASWAVCRRSCRQIYYRTSSTWPPMPPPAPMPARQATMVRMLFDVVFDVIPGQAGYQDKCVLSHRAMPATMMYCFVIQGQRGHYCSKMSRLVPPWGHTGHHIVSVYVGKFYHSTLLQITQLCK